MTENSENPTETQPDPAASTETPRSEVRTSPADADHDGGTASPDSATLGGISDDQLPEDLQPGEDNPLAEPLDPEAEGTKSREELDMDATQEDLGSISDGPGEAPDQAGDESSS